MKNIEFIKEHLNEPYANGIQEEAFWHSDIYFTNINFVWPILNTVVDKGLAYPVNRVTEDVMFDWIDIFYCWWLEQEYDGWWERFKYD